MAYSRWRTRSPIACRTLPDWRRSSMPPINASVRPEPPIAGLQQDRPAVGTGMVLVKFSDDRLARQIRKQNTLSCAIVIHAKAFVVRENTCGKAFLARSRPLCFLNSVESRSGAVVVGEWLVCFRTFRCRCPYSRSITPFPLPAHRTGQALFRHPALGQDITPSPTEGCASA